MADFNKLAHNVVQELRAGHVTYLLMAKQCGISRQAFNRRLKDNALTTENLTVLCAMSVTWVGGSKLVEFMEGTTSED